MTLYSMVWDWRVSGAGPILLIGLAARALFASCYFPFLFFHSMGGYCEVVVFGLIGWVLIAVSQPCITNLF